MKKIREALGKLAAAMKLNQKFLARAQRRYAANRKRAFKAHNEARHFEAKSDRLRTAGHVRKAENAAKEATRKHTVAFKNHGRAQFWLGRIKVLQQRIAGIDARQDKLHAELKKLQHVTIKGNHAFGGSPKERFRAVVLASVANCSSGKRRNFYSMAGSWDINHVIVPGERYGERSDCSSTVTGWCWSAGLPDPNGANWTGGYTGTLISESNGWKEVSRERMINHGWGYIVYGSGVGHHTEAYIGPGDRTGGHGSAPVDFGVIDLFGSGEYQRYFIYVGD